MRARGRYSLFIMLTMQISLIKTKFPRLALVTLIAPGISGKLFSSLFADNRLRLGLRPCRVCAILSRKWVGLITTPIQIMNNEVRLARKHAGNEEKL